jgi:isopenicillin-N epimerase
VTPQAVALSAGLVCFDVDGHEPYDFVDRLYARKRIVASVTPYSTRHVRLGPSILNTPADVDRAVRAVRSLVSS